MSQGEKNSHLLFFFSSIDFIKPGKVVINGLYTGEVIENRFTGPVLCVALEPDYAKSKKRSFVCGGRGGTLVLNVKGL